MMTSTQSDAGSVAPGIEHDEAVIPSTPFTNYEKRKTTVLVAIFGALLLVAIVVIPTSIVLGNKQNSSSSSNSNNIGKDSNSNGNGSPLSNDNESPYFQAITQYFTEEGVTSEETFASNDSPQRQAAYWLAETDTFHEDSYIPQTNITENDGYIFLSRYVMAVNYFALGGDKWNPDLNFLSPDSVCSWNNNEPGLELGVFCDEYEEIPRWIMFNDIGMEGEIPSENGKMLHLYNFEIQGNVGVKGTIPETICELGTLDSLALAYTSLTGTIPSCLGDLNSISLLFDGNMLSGPIPSGLGKMPLLSTLWINDNMLTGPLPDDLGDAINMISLYVDDNPHLNGNPLPILNRMTNISTIMLNNCDFEGEIDETFLADNWFVAAVDMSHNRFTSPAGIPATLLERPYLEVLDLSANLLSGPFPSEIQVLSGPFPYDFPIPDQSYFNYLSVYDNKLTGQIPSDLAKFALLDHIDVSNNRFTGVMPDWLGQMTQMGFLFLSLNPFTSGPIPESFANFTFIQELSLRGTSRTGPLPSFSGSDMSALYLLDLGSNSFTGPIPESYGLLPNLEFLLLNNNTDISSSIPSTFANLELLRALYVDKTGLTGDMDIVCSLPNIADNLEEQEGIFANCVQGGPVTCNCGCTCFDSSSAGSQPLLGNLDGSTENQFHRKDDMPVFHIDAAAAASGGQVTNTFSQSGSQGEP